MAGVDPGVLAAVLGAVVLGGVLQRTSGMGTGLVVSPTFVLLVGPVAGVMLTNVTTVASALALTLVMRRDIDWRRFVRIAPAIVVGSVPAALVVRATDAGWLEVVIGGALLLALAPIAFSWRLPDLGRLAAPVAGVTGGFLNTAVGVGGPAVLLYAHATSWSQRAFAATLQPIFLTMGAVSLLTKWAVGATSGPDALPGWPLVLAAVASVPLGVVLGGWVARRVSARTARRTAVALVTVGATTTLVRGLLAVL
ncbi:sulfite exporter TauE/SafE family protein [Georgenia sp. 311]|uniref:Probable membrane transporter protein n=1 Tax=Georgenia wutianyii TaxID=2585135 RepID=A0ABX5VKV6_9MICO|nr:MULTISPECIES: sulfite exporter TauE/SafE family protein [Georgenia]QDB79099.1 sulfite exporter TauE/SafE family protein [Georgenia wutianyii]TNC17078.1 sulfite exporter TauE/SafE family protein [Georgenia sp. 311]